MSLLLSFEPNGTSHGDLLLRYGPYADRCDSYYMAIDSGIAAEREDEAKVRIVLEKLLLQWREVIEHTGNGEVAYLPYDFVDEYMGFLRCKPQDASVEIVSGTSVAIQGHSYEPTDCRRCMRDVVDFSPSEWRISMSQYELLTGIEDSIRALFVSDL